MLSREVAQKVLGRCLITGGDFAEIFEEDSLNNSISILNGKVENSIGGRSYGIGIRIFKGLKSVYAYTNNNSLTSLLNVAQKAALALGDLKEEKMIVLNERENININPNNTVSLLTIHKAKGLEFEVVFVIGFNEGILPGYKSKGRDLEEERRLAYVAMTRAKNYLYLYCSIIHFINGNIAKMKPSSFLVEAGIKESNVMEFFGNYWYNH